ncbi:MAG: hypothetical protein FIB06_05595 [Betaproteobacteria bacterium]|nr:hypothetical protein [Betaproteobacteria bacterium]
MRHPLAIPAPKEAMATPTLHCIPEPMIDYDVRDTLRDIAVQEISFGRFREALVGYLGQMH